MQISPKEGQYGGEAGILLVDLLRGGGAGRGVGGHPGGKSTTDMGNQLQQQPSVD